VYLTDGVFLYRVVVEDCFLLERGERLDRRAAHQRASRRDAGGFREERRRAGRLGLVASDSDAGSALRSSR
jgi:hypothetical protein